MNLSTNQLAAIDEQLCNGNIIAAVTEYRRLTDAQLGDAKKFIDGRLDQLRREQPLRFAVTAFSPTLAPQLMQQIKPLDEHALFPIRSTMEQMEQLLYGYNYAVTLSVNAAALPTSDLPIRELMSVLYPKSTPYNATTLPVRFEEFVNDVTECLTYDGNLSAGPQFTHERKENLTNALLPRYWQQLNDLSPLDSCSILTYSSDVGLPGYYVFWFFAYLIHAPLTKRCGVPRDITESCG